MRTTEAWVHGGTACFAGLALLATCQAAWPAPDSSADRRARPVTSTEPHRALGEALARLGKQADVPLTATQHLADRRVTIFARERPLGELMSCVEELWSLPQFPARWRSFTKEADPVELRQDPRAELELERRLQADRERIIQGLERAVGLADSRLPPPPTAGDPVGSMLLQPANWRFNGRAMTHLFASMNAQGRQRFANGGLMVSPFSALPERTRSVLANDHYAPTHPTEGDPLAALASQQIGLQLMLEENGPFDRHWLLLMSFQKEGSNGAMSAGIPIAPLDVSSDPSLDAPPTESLPDALRKALSPEIRKALSRVGTGGTDGAPWKEWSDFLAFLHKEAGFTLLADYHHDRKPPDPRKLAEAKSYAQLIGDAARASGYRWRWSKGSLLFRNRTWYRDDLLELPATLETKAEASLAARGYLDVETILLLSQLSDKQLHRLRDRAPTVGELTAYRCVFGWVRQLTPRQRRQVESDTGLRVVDSSPQAQLALFPAERPDPTLAMFTEPAGIRISGFNQVLESEGMVTRIQVQGPQGANSPSVILRFVQPLRKAAQPSTKPANEGG